MDKNDKYGPNDKKNRRIGPRKQCRKRQQVGRGLDLSTAIDLGRRPASSRLGKMMINDAIDYVQTA